MEFIGDYAEWELKVLRARNKVIQEEVSYRQEIVNNLQRVELDMARALGASELEILELKEEYLELQYQGNKNESYMLELGKLRVQQSIELAKEKAKEVEVLRNLALAYEKADVTEKERIRRAIELTRLDASELVSKYKRDAYDRNIILDYWNYFKEESQEAITDAIWELRRLPGELTKLEARDLLPEDEILRYWKTFTEKGFEAVDAINERLRRGMPSLGVSGGLMRPMPTAPAPAPPTPTPTGYKVRSIYGGVTKEGHLYMTDSLERLERMITHAGESLEKLEGIREAIENGTLKTEEVRKQIERSLGY
jgi:hypothetical protein